MNIVLTISREFDFAGPVWEQEAGTRLRGVASNRRRVGGPVGRTRVDDQYRVRAKPRGTTPVLQVPALLQVATPVFQLAVPVSRLPAVSGPQGSVDAGPPVPGGIRRGLHPVHARDPPADELPLDQGTGQVPREGQGQHPRQVPVRVLLPPLRRVRRRAEGPLALHLHHQRPARPGAVQGDDPRPAGEGVDVGGEGHAAVPAAGARGLLLGHPAVARRRGRRLRLVGVLPAAAQSDRAGEVPAQRPQRPQRRPPHPRRLAAQHPRRQGVLRPADPGLLAGHLRAVVSAGAGAGGTGHPAVCGRQHFTTRKERGA
ncbi:unnamed protein product [Gemmataceae bacterium]|nr:unnamed protein product [Gemmataceae bacterium]VTT96348.1 unnamed protein product [Gemmataceae bacterium]